MTISCNRLELTRYECGQHNRFYRAPLIDWKLRIYRKIINIVKVIKILNVVRMDIGSRRYFI